MNSWPTVTRIIAVCFYGGSNTKNRLCAQFAPSHCLCGEMTNERNKAELCGGG